MTERIPGSSIIPLLSQVMADVGAVAKRDENQHHGFLFRGIDAVVNAVSPALVKHGVVVIPSVLDREYEHVTTSQNKPATACRVRVTYRFYAPDGDSVAATVVGEAWDNGDKATPKAMSVAFRTALLQALTLPTHDRDPDAESFERGTKVPMMTQQQITAIGGLFNDLGIDTEEGQLDALRKVVGRDTNGGDLTQEEATRFEDALRAQLALRTASNGESKGETDA